MAAAVVTMVMTLVTMARCFATPAGMRWEEVLRVGVEATTAVVEMAEAVAEAAAVGMAAARAKPRSRW